MQTVIRRIFAGFGAYISVGLLTWLTSVSMLPRILRAASEGMGDANLWQIYTDAGQPVWKAVTWLVLSVHFVPLRVQQPGGGWAWQTLMRNQTAAPDWLYLIPAISCFAAGVTVIFFSSEPDAIEWAIGSYLAIGYTIAAVASAVLSRLTIETVIVIDRAAVDATATIVPRLLNPVTLIWPLAMVGYPLLFSSLGAVVGQSSFLQRARSSR